MARTWLSRCLDLAIVGLTLALVAGGVLGARAYEHAQRAERAAIDLTASLPTAPDGGWSAKEIRVRVGEEVAIRLTSEDVTHGFLIPDLGVQSDPIQAGAYQTIRFRADRPGVYTYYCYVLCSHRHGAMIGKLIVEG
jgi:heme/copper-type cytochrome/quinol oxidase subunit 2